MLASSRMSIGRDVTLGLACGRGMREQARMLSTWGQPESMSTMAPPMAALAPTTSARTGLPNEFRADTISPPMFEGRAPAWSGSGVILEHVRDVYAGYRNPGFIVAHVRIDQTEEARIVSRALTLLSAAIAMTLATPPANAMSGYRWKYRPVVVLAGAGGDAALAEQRRMFAANRAGLAERDIVVVWVTGNNVRAELGPGPGLTAAQLRARFGATETGFRVVLVGKYGGTKLTQSTPLSTATLFGTIDSMPMRRSEARRGP